MKNLQNISDSDLLNLCLKFGARALKWRRRFIGLLPEVDRRKLYEKKGFDSIFEFAFKLAGLSQEQVRRAINLEQRFSSMPTLKNILIEGAVSVNKLTRIASIATPENEEELAEIVKVLPRGALETMVRDYKISAENPSRNETSGGQGKPLFGGKSVHVHTQFKISLPNFQLSDEVIEKFNHLQLQGHDINQIILQMLEKRQKEIEARKEELAKEAIARMEAKRATLKPGEKLKTSGYISVKVQAVLDEEHGTKCSVPGCCKPAVENHHSQRLSLVRVHDPRYIAPMCREHHQIAHLIDQRYREKHQASLSQAAT